MYGIIFYLSIWCAFILYYDDSTNVLKKQGSEVTVYIVSEILFKYIFTVIPFYCVRGSHS